MALILVISQRLTCSALLRLARTLRSQSFPCCANFSTVVNCFGHNQHPLSYRIAGRTAISNKDVSSGRFSPKADFSRRKQWIHWIPIFELLKWFCKPISVSNGELYAALSTTGSLPTIRWFFFPARISNILCEPSRFVNSIFVPKILIFVPRNVTIKSRRV